MGSTARWPIQEQLAVLGHCRFVLCVSICGCSCQAHAFAPKCVCDRIGFGGPKSLAKEGAPRSWQCDRVHCRTTSQRRHSSRHLLPVPLPSTSADKIALHFSQLIVGLPSTQVALTWHFLRPQLKLMYADPCLRALSPFGIPTVCSLAAPPVVEARNVRDLLPTFRVLFEIG